MCVCVCVCVCVVVVTLPSAHYAKHLIEFVANTLNNKIEVPLRAY